MGARRPTDRLHSGSKRPANPERFNPRFSVLASASGASFYSTHRRLHHRLDQVRFDTQDFLGTEAPLQHRALLGNSCNTHCFALALAPGLGLRPHVEVPAQLLLEAAGAALLSRSVLFRGVPRGRKLPSLLTARDLPLLPRGSSEEYASSL